MVDTKRQRREKWKRLIAAATIMMASVFPVSASVPAQAVEMPVNRSQVPQQAQFPQLSNITFGKEITGPKIPQTRDRRWVHQGLEYLPLERWFVMTAYVHGPTKPKREASKLSVVDEATAEKVKTVQLFESENRKHMGHVGGVTATDSHLYVASTAGKEKYLLLRYRLEDLRKASDGDKLVADKVYRLPHRTSYVKYSPHHNWLLVGQWVPNKSKKAGTLQAYWLDEQGDPHYVREFRTPKSVQGIELIRDEAKKRDIVIYSISTGRKNYGQLLVKNGLGAKAKKVFKRKLKTTMTQNVALVLKNGLPYLAIGNESGAAKYKDGARKISPYLSIVPIKEREERVKD